MSRPLTRDSSAIHPERNNASISAVPTPRHRYSRRRPLLETPTCASDSSTPLARPPSIPPASNARPHSRRPILRPSSPLSASRVYGAALAARVTRHSPYVGTRPRPSARLHSYIDTLLSSPKTRRDVPISLPHPPIRIHPPPLDTVISAALPHFTAPLLPKRLPLSRRDLFTRPPYQRY